MPQIKIQKQDLEVAINLFVGDCKTLDDPEHPIHATFFPACEKNLFIEQAKANLSEEAKEVMSMLMNCPLEIYEELTGGGSKLGIHRLRKYLKECCLPHKTINNVFSELKQFKNEMEEGV